MAAYLLIAGGGAAISGDPKKRGQKIAQGMFGCLKIFEHSGGGLT